MAQAITSAWVHSGHDHGAGLASTFNPRDTDVIRRRPALVATLILAGVIGSVGCADPVDLHGMKADVAELRTRVDALSERVHQVASHPPATPTPATSIPATTTTATTTTTTTAGSGTSEPPTATLLLRSPTAEDPLRVMVVGDSVTYEIEPALTAALQRTGRVVSANRTQVGFGLSRWSVYRWWEIWIPFLAEVRPEAVIIQTGIWDVNDVWGSDDRIPRPEDPDWEDSFAFLVRMAVDVLSADGAHVYWLTMLPSSESDGPGRLTRLLVEVASGDDRLSVVDLTPGFTDDEGEYINEIDRFGEPWPVRKIGGVHLCREGAAVAARSAAEAVLADAGLVVFPGWEKGLWRANPLYDVDPCDDPVN